MVDRSTVYRWVQRFGPELTKRTGKHLRRARVDWHVPSRALRCNTLPGEGRDGHPRRWEVALSWCPTGDCTAICRKGWRAIDANGQMIDFRLTARRDAKAAKAFLNKAIERVRLHRPVTIHTDKAPTYKRIIQEENRRYDTHFDGIRHVDKKWRNNPIESDHAARKRLLGYRQSFRSLRTAKATLSGIEIIRTIKRGHIHHKQPGVTGEIAFIKGLFDPATA